MRVFLAVLLAIGCKSKGAPEDARDGGIYGGVPRSPTVRPGGDTEPPGAPSTRRADCPVNNGTVKLETNADLDTTCVTVFGDQLAFAVGAHGGHKLSFNTPSRKGDPAIGVTYQLKGNEVVADMFSKEQADKLAAQPLIMMAVYRGAELPKEIGTLGLGHGTVTFRKLPPAGKSTPFVADFDFAFESWVIKTAGTTITKVKTGTNYQFKGTVTAN